MKAKNYLILIVFIASLIIGGCNNQVDKCSNNIVHSLDNTKIFYKVCGNGPTALVFIHGWCCNGNYWKNQVEQYKDKYTVVTIDLAGHGLSGSSRKDYTFDAYAEDVKSVVSRLGNSKVILIGHSMSGVVITKAANLLPGKVAAIIGADTLQDVSIKLSQPQIEHMLKDFEDNGFEAGMRSFLTDMFTYDDNINIKNSVIADMSAANPEIALNTIRNYFNEYSDNGSMSDSARNCKVPAYCINADLWPTNEEANKSVFPNFKGAEIIENAGHFLMLTHPTQFNAKLDIILKDLGL